MNCPKCNAAMEPVKFEEVIVDRCTGCKGMWFDFGEVKKLVGMRGSQNIDIGDVQVGKRTDKITNINCPKCQQPMSQEQDVDQHHITYERCDNCKGVFLDAGEFKDLRTYSVMDYFKGLFKHAPKKKA